MRLNAKVEVGHCYKFRGPYQWGTVGIVHEIIHNGESARIHLLQGDGPLHSYVGQIIRVNTTHSVEEIELTDLDRLLL